MTRIRAADAATDALTATERKFMTGTGSSPRRATENERQTNRLR
ncbi:hypothetical protein [Streptomyces sp. NBC_00063]|nr:hypothetical protein [Streptomyces sp. NBC_00063]MCX5435334.1 hypothetical protein [Streptomyces sp. NBC_00063]